MSVLPVPGGRLYYETVGDGPLLALVPGASGTAESFRRLSTHLAESYTVAVYDRRGFSRSRPDGPPDPARRLDIDADDLRRLVDHLGSEPATIVGVSSGATVGLHTVVRHPAIVGTLVAFEPPVVRLLPDGQRWVDFFDTVYDRYQRSGPEAALQQFREETFAPSDRIAMAHATDLHAGGAMPTNLTYWFEHELRQYPAVIVDLDRLRAAADRIIPAAGRDSSGYPCREATIALGKQLGRRVLDLPGGHLGCLTHPAEFTTELTRALTRRAADSE